ncbi:MAG: diguanylate cyclase, partial [Treponema sp.]|nr:diguanylate cyclase [Treponema sp.]
MAINNSKGLNEKFIQIMHMPASSVQGTLSALNMFICIIMVFIHYDYGKKLGISCIGFSILSSIIFIIRTHILTPIPGIATSLISLITIEVFARYYKKITISSLTDYLTGLKNRRAFVNDLEDNIDSRTPFYLAYFDMKNFQSLNASYGVEAGNAIVKTITGRLSGRIEKDDILYRMESSTSFALIFRPNKDAEKKVKELLYSLKRPIHFEQNGNDHEYNVEMVAALIKYPEDGNSFLELTKCVDIAITYAKDNHQDFTIYSNKEIQQKQKLQIEAENLINEALQNNYFFMVYQPQFDIKSKKLRGFESLIRCKKPDGTIVSPGVFIPV